MIKEETLIQEYEDYMRQIDESGMPKWVSDYYINYQNPIKNMEIKTRTELEMFAAHITQNLYDIPDNLRLLIIVEKEDFDKMFEDIAPQPPHFSDRFIYKTYSGVEFGIKCNI